MFTIYTMNIAPTIISLKKRACHFSSLVATRTHTAASLRFLSVSVGQVGERVDRVDRAAGTDPFEVDEGAYQVHPGWVNSPSGIITLQRD